MALAVYVKIAQGRLAQPFAARSWLALSATWGGAVKRNWRALSTKEMTLEKHAETILEYPKVEERKLYKLLKQKEFVSNELDNLTDERMDLSSSLTTLSISESIKGNLGLNQDQGVFMDMEEAELLLRFRSLWNRVEFLFKILESTEEEIENLRSRLNKEIVRKVHDLLSMEDTLLNHQFQVGCFELMREATQYFDLLDFLLKNGCNIKYDPNCLEVLAKELTEKYRLIEKFPFLNEELLQRGLNFLFEKLKTVYFAELRCKFYLFLLSCDIELSVMCDILDFEARAHEAKVIQQMEEFQSQFSELDELDVRRGLQVYRKYQEGNCGRDDQWRSAYEEDMLKALELEKKQCMQIDNPFSDYRWLKVFRTWKEGYRMDIYGDPETEITKLEKHLEEIENATKADKQGPLGDESARNLTLIRSK